MMVAAVRECRRWKQSGNFLASPNERRKWKVSVNFLETYWKPRCPSSGAKPRARGGKMLRAVDSFPARTRAAVIAGTADSYALASLPVRGPDAGTRIFTSTREPRRFKIDINRSAVNLPRSAFRIREKSAAVKPVWAWAARTVSSSRSSVLMISAAKSAFNCSISAFSRPRSRNTFPLPRTNEPTQIFRFSSECLLQSFQPIFHQGDLVLRRLDACLDFFWNAWITQISSAIWSAQTTRKASPRCARAISSTPEPKPCKGLPMSAFAPSAAIVSAPNSTR